MEVSCVPGILMEWIEVESCKSPIHDVRMVSGFEKSPDTNETRRITINDLKFPGKLTNPRSAFLPPNAEPFSGDQVQPGWSMAAKEGQ